MSYTSQLTGAQIDSALQLARSMGDSEGLVYGTGSHSIAHRRIDSKVSLSSTGIPSTKAVADAISDAAGQYLTYKGAVADLTALAAIQDPQTGDAWFVISENSSRAWNGSEWTMAGTYSGVAAVNGVLPDADNNVNIDASDIGAVVSVNGKSPTADGNVAITATDVGAVATVCGKSPSSGNVAITSTDVGAVSTDNVLTLEQIKASTSLTGKIPEAQALLDALTLKSGESMSYNNLLCPGFISSGTTMVNLSFFCGRPYANGNLTVTALTGGIRKDNSGYLSDGSVANNDSNWLTGSNVKSVACSVHNGMVLVAITLKTAPSGVSNNSNMTGYININFTKQ